jgi:hypothetical protein
MDRAHKMRYDATTRAHVHPDGTAYPSIPEAKRGVYPGGGLVPAYALPARKFCLSGEEYHLLPNEGDSLFNEEADAILRSIGDVHALAAWMRSRHLDILIFYFFSASAGTDVTSPTIVPIAIGTAKRRLVPISWQPDFIGGGRRSSRDRSPSPARPGQRLAWISNNTPHEAHVEPHEWSHIPPPASSDPRLMSGLCKLPGTSATVRPVDPWDMPPLAYREYRVNSIPETADPYVYLYSLAHDRLLGQYIQGAYVVNGGVWSYLQVPDSTWPLKRPRPARYAGTLSTVPRAIPGPPRSRRSSTMSLEYPVPRTCEADTGAIESSPHECGETRCPLCRVVTGLVIIKWEGCMAIPQALGKLEGPNAPRCPGSSEKLIVGQVVDGNGLNAGRPMKETSEVFAKSWLINTRLERAAVIYARHGWDIIFVTDAEEKDQGNPPGIIQEIIDREIVHGTLCARPGTDSISELLDDEIVSPSGRPLVLYETSLNALVSANSRTCGLRCPLATVHVDGNNDCILTGHQAPGLRLADWVVCPQSI